MDNKKKVYEEPTVKIVEFDFSERFSFSDCGEFPDDCTYDDW